MHCLSLLSLISAAITSTLLKLKAPVTKSLKKYFADSAFDLILSCVTGKSSSNKYVLFLSFYQWDKQYIFLEMQPRNGTIGLKKILADQI